MTKSIILTTPVGKTEVAKAVTEVGFKPPIISCGSYVHQSVDNLVIQIHAMSDNGIQIGTRMEFDDLGDQLPHNPGAIEVLELLCKKLPDLMYTEYTSPPKSSPDCPLSEYIDSLK